LINSPPPPHTLEKNILIQSGYLAIFSHLNYLGIKNFTSKYDLSYLAEKYGSDKGNLAGTAWHNYTQIYENLFEPIKNEVKYVYENGIFKGASLRIWRDYFPNAEIYGGDIDKETLFEEDRIKTGFIDQLDPIAINEYFKDKNVEFDIMLDDGYHVYDAGICLFENSIQKLKSDGFYIIEDISFEDLPKYKEYFINNKKYDAKFVIMGNSYRIDNNLIIIQKNNV
jgi:6-pyruvoyl-tetrahydropterin synthase